MKILYSDLKKLVPGLRANPKQAGDFLTMAGFMLDGFSKVKYQGKPDFLMSFEVRYNRADCLAVMGLAREVAAKWGLKMNLPNVGTRHGAFMKSQFIRVKNGKFVKRIIAFEVSGLQNKKSPQWLVEYLAHYEMNSKNLLVDLSNYVMLLTGYPSHLLDKSKIKSKLYWDVNEKFNSITTLDGTLIPLKKDNEIILRDDEKILALAGIVGGKNAELELKTTSIIAEAAIYDSGTVRKNASNLKISTEAGNRLSKYLDPNGLDYAMNLLLSLILEHAGNKDAEVKIFNYYPKKHSAPRIKFDPAKPAIFTGIGIPKNAVLKILDNLGFKVGKSSKFLMVTPPIGRMDIEIEEDVVEEVVRMHGFEKIPANIIPKQQVTNEITPRIVKLSEKIRDILAIQGFDEILSYPLTSKKANLTTNYRTWQIVTTQNSVNEEYPDLRQTIAGGLLFQLEEYRRKNLVYKNLFEIGKVFGKANGQYQENESLGILAASQFTLDKAKDVLELILKNLGVTDVKYQDSKKKPEAANPYTCFDVIIDENVIGILYKLIPDEFKEKVYLTEINLSQLSSVLPHYKQIPVYELMQKLVILDANVELSKNDSIDNFIQKLKAKIGKRYLWDLSIVDAFPTENKVKYTIRATYMKLSDQEAKKLHLKVFKLK